MTKKPTANATATTQNTKLPRNDESAKPSSETSAVATEKATPATASALESTSAPSTVKTSVAGASAEGSKKEGALQIVTRFPADLGARLDSFTESLRNDRFGLRVSRADAVRILVNEALKAHEAKAATKSS